MPNHDEGFQAFLDFLQSGNNSQHKREELSQKKLITTDDEKKIDDASDEGYNDFLSFLCCNSTNDINQEQPATNGVKDNKSSGKALIAADIDTSSNTWDQNAVPSNDSSSNHNDNTQQSTQQNDDEDHEYNTFLTFLESSSIINKEMNKVAQDDPAKTHREMYKFVNLEVDLLFSLLDADSSGGADISKIWGYLKESTHWVCEPRAGNSSVLT
eukprot:CCRYP_008389-RA/>CCRYP_008389-RA protein AED:0.26 eAED:0.26 QI:0/-1/0/1/-1/1/1/0/212